MKQLDGFFRLSQRGTTLGREIRGGCTTFCSMVYLILVIPGLLSGAGMDFEKVMTATCLIAAAGSIVSGLLSNLPFALAPGLGFTTLFTHTLCQKYGCTWQQALALVLVSGVLFLALTFSPLRERLNDALPMPFKFALSAGVGLFLTLSGLINAGLITADDNLVDMGTLAAPEPLLALLGIFVTAVLVMKKVPGALMLGMALTVALGIPLGVTALPQTLTAAPELSLAALKPDFTGLLALGPIPLVSALLSLLVSQYFDALGTLLAVAGDAKLTDTTGDLDGQREAMLCCGAATCAGALLGVSNVTAMAESATGIREGTRTGLSAVITGLLFWEDTPGQSHNFISGCCAVGSAPALGAGGPGFESPHSDQILQKNRLFRRFFCVLSSAFVVLVIAVLRRFKERDSGWDLSERSRRNRQIPNPSLTGITAVFFGTDTRIS